MTFEEAAARYRSAGILIDTNILLLYVVGAYDPDSITRHKRTDRFVPADYALLLNVLERFERVVTTPHILTDTNSLAGQAPDHLRAGVMQAFEAVAIRMREEHTSARVLAGAAEFTRFGIADCAVLHEARGRHLVLTDDFRLPQLLQHQGTDVVNFNHLRLNNVRE